MKRNETIVKCVEVFVAEENIPKFIEATKKNALFTRKEPGNLRFEIHQSTQDPTQFFFFEAYKNEEAIKIHKATDYYKEWCKVAEPLMKGSRRTNNCKIVFSDQL